MCKQIKKRVTKILRNPKTVKFEELDKILVHFGFERSQKKGGSSHYVYRKKGGNPITVPKHKPVKEFYIKNVIKILNLEEWINE